MPIKTTGKGLQRVTSRVQYVMDPDKPCPREHVTKGTRPCCAALENNFILQPFYYKTFQN